MNDACTVCAENLRELLSERALRRILCDVSDAHASFGRLDGSHQLIAVCSEVVLPLALLR